VFGDPVYSVASDIVLDTPFIRKDGAVVDRLCEKDI